jgi:hypothetical protein
MIWDSDPSKCRRSSSFPKCPRPALGQPSLLYRGYRRTFQGQSGQGMKLITNLTPHSGTGVKNVWSYTSAQPIRLHGVDRDSSTVACRLYMLKGRVWGSLYSVAKTDADIGYACLDRISGYIYMCVTEHNRMSQLRRYVWRTYSKCSYSIFSLI